MNCPTCKTINLVMAERQGIEIDYCPQCRGVWLDRGELDKIIERSATATIVAAPRTNAPQPYANQRHESHHDRDDHRHKRKREGFLSEIFDFD